jgi:hypothetical protein
VEIWHLVFTHLNLSDAFQVLRVSKHFNKIIMNYDKQLKIDTPEPLKNKNWNTFVNQWLGRQTKLNVSLVDLAPHELVRIIDKFCKIKIIIASKLVEETVFFELLSIYAKLDPSSYRDRRLYIKLGNNNKTKQIRDGRIRDFYDNFPNGRIFRQFCPSQIREITLNMTYRCHECYEQRHILYRCSKCKSKCCRECINHGICDGCM